jgi:hypothetical protein
VRRATGAWPILLHPMRANAASTGFRSRSTLQQLARSAQPGGAPAMVRRSISRSCSAAEVSLSTDVDPGARGPSCFMRKSPWIALTFAASSFSRGLGSGVTTTWVRSTDSHLHQKSSEVRYSAGTGQATWTRKLTPPSTRSTGLRRSPPSRPRRRSPYSVGFPTLELDFVVCDFGLFVRPDRTTNCSGCATDARVLVRPLLPCVGFGAGGGAEGLASRQVGQRARLKS